MQWPLREKTRCQPDKHMDACECIGLATIWMEQYLKHLRNWSATFGLSWFPKVTIFMDEQGSAMGSGELLPVKSRFKGENT